MELLLFFLSFALGAAFAILAAGRSRRRRLAQAQAQTQTELRAARSEAEHRVRDASLQAEGQAGDLKQKASAEFEAEARQLSEYDHEIATREEVLAERERDLDELEADVKAREQRHAETNAKRKAVQEEIRATRETQIERLQESAGLTCEQLGERYVSEQVSRTELAAQKRLRDLEEETKEAAPKERRRIMAIAVERFDGSGQAERMQGTVPFTDPRPLAALSEQGSRTAVALARHTGCEVICDLAGKTVSVRGEDPMAREVARRALKHMAKRSVSSPEKIRAICRQVKADLAREVAAAGKKAFRALGLERAHPELVQLVGRLKFRLSYSQNQLKHALEVAYLAGIMAEELGLDVRLARRGGLLHDIGKAITHEQEGSHAALGAAVARRLEEPEVVANAIGAHHNDEPSRSPIADLVTAADALSGARPGARRESVTLYLDRIQEIHEVASQSSAVRRVDIMQAGREVRVFVAGHEWGGDTQATEADNKSVLGEEELHTLAAQIARRIEEEVTFAGQIRVTVIQESRAVAVAH